MHIFSDTEGLRIAVEIERRGEDFYTRASRITSSPDTRSMLLSLAQEERAHGKEFGRLYNLACARRGESPDEAYDDETNAYLSAIAAEVVFPGGLMSLKETGFDSPVGVLQTAIASEKDSILFYMELAGRAKDQETRASYEEIARQERGHLALLIARLDGLYQTKDTGGNQ